MDSTSFRLKVVIVVAALAVLVPGIVLACGPYFWSAVFVPSRPTDNKELLTGKLGIVQRSFSRQELFLAYRSLSGQPQLPRPDRSDSQPR